MDLGKTIRIFRVAAGLKQKELAEKLKVSTNYLSMIETGKREPSLSFLKEASKVFDIPLSFFFWDSDIKDEKISKEKRDVLSKLRDTITEIHKIRLHSIE